MVTMSFLATGNVSKIFYTNTYFWMEAAGFNIHNKHMLEPNSSFS